VVLLALDRGSLASGAVHNGQKAADGNEKKKKNVNGVLSCSSSSLGSFDSRSATMVVVNGRTCYVESVKMDPVVDVEKRKQGVNEDLWRS